MLPAPPMVPLGPVPPALIVWFAERAGGGTLGTTIFTVPQSPARRRPRSGPGRLLSLPFTAVWHSVMEETRAALTSAQGRSQRGGETTERFKRSAPVANIKSQIKRITTNEKARQRNQAIRSSVKTAIRKFREAADAGDKAKAIELQKDAAKKLDKAVTKGVLHANQAANKKSALAKRANSL
ncbi:hypothetical protein GCM10027598_53420 [Amycolatopsis oliviviridis]